MKWTVEKVTEATRGQLIRGNPRACLGNVSTDTRRIQPGDCFVALSGENHDAHDFLRDALKKGAAALVVSKPELDVDEEASFAVIRVPDTLHALGDLARAWRDCYSIPVVGITGSNGKTSTKEMIASILSQTRTVLKNQGNLNNLVGAPLTLLSLQPEHQAAVIEMGINIPGEMKRLVEIADPTVGLITNIHPAHLEGLVSVDRILEEKSRLWTQMREDGLAVVSLDDERLASFASPDRVRGRAVTWSMHNPEARAHLVGDVELSDSGSFFRIALDGEVIEIRFSVLGMHQVQNAVAAAAVGWAMGESAQAIRAGLESHLPVRQRMQVHRLKDGRVLIDDTYNANPRSMLAAVRTAAAAGRGMPVIAVLGEMRELGPQSPILHREVGREIGDLGLSRLITLGELGEEICRGARDAGMLPAACLHLGSHKEAVEWLLDHGREKSWILVKGSRGMTMERVVEGLLGNGGEGPASDDD